MLAAIGCPLWHDAHRSATRGGASLILPLRHPAHVAKAAVSADVLSGGRLLLGIASGDRPEEYPALDVPFDAGGALPLLVTGGS